jgi:peptidoglycan-N-acetylglucosamine deacetylase
VLNSYNIRLIFLVAMLGLAVYYWVYGLPLWAFAVPVALYGLAVAYGSYFIEANFFFKSYCNGSTTQKHIALSFDDGPAQYTAQVLQILQDYGVEAAFFCIGNRIAGNEAILQQIHQEGHLIGNHSFSHHFWFDLYSASKMQSDLAQMNQLAENVTGLKLRLFRPPYGVTNPNLKKAIKAGDFVSVGWNVRSLDTVIKDPQKLLQRVNKRLKPGAIVLFHDTNATTVTILPAFIKQALANGYQIVRLDKMLNINAYH